MVKPKNKSKKIYIRTGFTLLAIGLMGLSIPILSFGFLSDFTFLNSAANSTYESQKSSVQFLEQNSRIPEKPLPQDQSHSNRLTILKIGVDMPIYYSHDAKVLLRGGWVFPNTSTPENGGNTVIFGHRFKFLPPASNTFFSLDKITKGDEFKITWNGKESAYRVTETKIIEPTDLSVLNPTEKTQITLITCAPLFSAKQRLVVIGEPIN